MEIFKAHGLTQTPNAVGDVINAPEKQRGGVYGTAPQMASCLSNRQVARWVTPQGEKDERPQFDPADFVRSKGTLYSLSKDGKGTAGPLVADWPHPWSVSWTKQPTSAAGANCRTSTATTAPAASC